MQHSRKLYEYVYEALVIQIECGEFCENREFFSQQEICLRYNVGITTVRKVLKLLDENGYIRTAQGAPAEVVYTAPAEKYIAAQVGRRNEISDAFRGLKLIMPALYREGAKSCSDAHIKTLRSIACNMPDRLQLPQFYRQVNAFFTLILQALNNNLALDLEADAESYLHVKFLSFAGTENYFIKNVETMQSFLNTAIIQIEEKRFDCFYDGALALFENYSEIMDKYLTALTQKAGFVPQKDKDIYWFRLKGRSELYSRLAMTIIRRIVSGEYDDEKYLSSIPKLMEDYGVMKDTASRAVALLNSLGFAKTWDKRGTVVAFKGATAIKGVNFNDPAIRERLSYFKDALEIITLSIGNCASSFPPASKSLIESMEDNMRSIPKTRFGPSSVQLLMDCVIRLIPYHSLENMFRQLDDLIVWGYYLQSIDESFYPDSSEIENAMRSVISALKNESPTPLPAALENAFSLISKSVDDVMTHI